MVPSRPHRGQLHLICGRAAGVQCEAWPRGPALQGSQGKRCGGGDPAYNARRPRARAPPPPRPPSMNPAPVRNYPAGARRDFPPLGGSPPPRGRPPPERRPRRPARPGPAAPPPPPTNGAGGAIKKRRPWRGAVERGGERRTIRCRRGRRAGCRPTRRRAPRPFQRCGRC